MKKKMIIFITLLIAVLAVVISTLLFSMNKEEKIKNGAITEIYSELPSQYNIDKIAKDSLSYKVLEKTYIEVKSEEYNTDGTGKLEITATSPDFVELMKQSMDMVDNLEDLKFTEQQNKIEENMCNKLDSNDYPTQERTVSVDVKKENGKWKIVHNEEFAKAISGDISFLLMDSVNKLLEE